MTRLRISDEFGIYMFIIGLILLLSTPKVVSQRCPYGWLNRPGSDSCYLVTHDDVPYTWPLARERCKSFQSDLVVLQTVSEWKWLRSQLSNIQKLYPDVHEWWIGLSNQQDGNRFVWTDGSNINNTLVKWETPPAKNTTLCARIQNLEFDTVKCTFWRTYICERSKKKPLSCEIDEGWTNMNNNCYKLFDGKRSYSGSSVKCQLEDAQLANVPDESTQTFLWGLAKKNGGNAWIGLSTVKQGKTYKWQWQNSTSLRDGHTYWKNGEPSQAVISRTNGSCVQIMSGPSVKRKISWKANDCTAITEFLCQKPQGVCQPGWLIHQTKCYQLNPRGSLSWNAANKYCTSQGGNLIKIETAGDQLYVNDNVLGNLKRGSGGVWIGVTDDVKNGSFKWSDGMPVGKFNNWAKVKSLNTPSKKDCGYIASGDPRGKWQTTTDCIQTKSFVCEIGVNKPVKTVTLPPKKYICDAGWTVFGQYCYQFNDTDTTWLDARHQCQDTGADLISIHDNDLQNFITGEVNRRKGDYWIGLHDRPAEGKYIWLDSTTKTNYTNWSPSEPNNLGGSENCVVVAGTKGKRLMGKWYDYICSTKYNFICQKPSQNSGIVTPPPTIPSLFNPKCGLFWEDNPHSSYCYQFHEELLSWFDAADTCRHHGGTLASIGSIQEQFYISGRVKDLKVMSLWIGASDRSLEGGWNWEDKGPFAYFNWDAGEPNNYGNKEDCGAMFIFTSRWNDYDCNKRNGYICKKLGLTVSTATTIPTTPNSLPAGKYYGCPPGWEGYRTKCYLVVRDTKTWLDSRNFCRQNGGDLASIADLEENNFIFSQTPAFSCKNIHTNDTQCTLWAQTGECKRNPIWMSNNCRHTCGLCYSTCENRNKKGNQCGYWAKIGECTKNPDYMLSNCMQSCKICDDGGQYDAVWLGLNDRNYEMKFSWTDGSSITFTKWDVGEPSNYRGKDEDCIKMFTQKALSPGVWNSDDCGSQQNGFVCKRRKSIEGIITVDPLSVGCPNGALGYESHCYNFISTPLNWDNAEQKCVSQKGHLATVNDRFVQAFVSAELVNKNDIYWIGLSDKLQPGTYQWTSQDKLLYTSWDSFHTGNERSTCVAMNTSHPIGLWSNGNCSIEKPFICQSLRDGFTTLLITTVAPTTPHVACHPGWVEYMDSCYKAYTIRKSWNDARRYCMNLGGDLASIHNSSAQTAIKFSLNRFLYRSTFWIGLNDKGTEGKHIWSDGTPLDFTSWALSEPSDKNGRDDCVEFKQSTKQWNDNNCYIQKNFICMIGRGINISLTTPAPISTEAPIACADNGWIYFNGSCYFISPAYGTDSKKSWYNSHRYCLSKGGDLVSIHSPEEDEFILSRIKSRSSYGIHWIGLTDLQGSYKWTDGSIVDYKSWGKNEPNDAYGGQRCVNFYSLTGDWNDDNCMDSFGYICKKLNLSSSVQPPTPTSIIPGGCPTNFRAADNSNKCFYVGGLKMEGLKHWELARNACRSLGHGADLASISNSYEQAFAVTLLKDTVTTGVWIGLFDKHINGKYTWSDNSEVTYTNWDRGEPSDHWSYSRFNRQDCVEIHSEAGRVGKWNDQKCLDVRAYLCQATRDTRLPAVPPTTKIRCQQGYSPYGTSCYKYVNQSKTWQEAQASCRLDSAVSNLVSVFTQYDQSFLDVMTYSLSSPYWIGLSDSQVKGAYNWVDGWPKMFSNWGGDEPSRDDGEGCVAMVKGKWNDTMCNVTYPHICMINTAPPPPTTAIPTGRCSDPTWTTFGDYCYYADFQNSKSWPEARYMCQKIGMELVSVQSKAELIFLKTLAQSTTFTTRRYFFHGSHLVNRIWIGLYKVDNAGFQWTDKTGTLYLNWATGEPSDTDEKLHEDCVEMYRNSGLWNDVDCFGNKAYICKAKKIMLTTTSPTTTTTTTPAPTVSSRTTSGQTLSVSTTFTANHLTAKRLSPWTGRPTYFPLIQHPAGTSSGLTGGQIAGIVIGVIGFIIIIVVFMTIVKRHKSPKTPPSMDSVGFDNALYSKNTSDLDVLSDDLNNETGVIQIGQVHD